MNQGNNGNSPTAHRSEYPFSRQVIVLNATSMSHHLHSFSRFGQNLKAYRVRIRGAQLDTLTRTAGVIPGPTATATFRPNPRFLNLLSDYEWSPVLALHALHSSVLTRSAWFWVILHSFQILFLKNLESLPQGTLQPEMYIGNPGQ